MQTPSTEQLEAVFLFQGDTIAREMLYSEFEAILDGFIPVSEYAGGVAKAVYVRVNSALTLSAAVFFVLEFDQRGIVDRRWNIPLRQLADLAARGPDLGAGPIRLACFSQCPIEWQRNNLWDPQMRPGCNSFVLMRKSLKQNRLGLVFKSLTINTAPSAASALTLNQQQHEHLEKKLHERYSQELRDRLAQVIKEQRLRITTFANIQKDKTRTLQQEHQQRLQHYQQQLQMSHEQVEVQTKLLADLEDKLLLQEQKLEGVREYFTHKLKAAQMSDSEQLQALQNEFVDELDLRVQSATSELQEMLDMREVELFYRHQQESNLKEEIAHLRRENQQLINQGGDQLLQKLTKAGISFVAYHPGAEHIAIACDDVADYLANPQVFAAAACGVSETLYGAWLTHFQAPTCVGFNHQGELCGKTITRIASPSEFHEGESDRCLAHQELVPQRMAEYR